MHTIFHYILQIITQSDTSKWQLIILSSLSFSSFRAMNKQEQKFYMIYLGI